MLDKSAEHSALANETKRADKCGAYSDPQSSPPSYTEATSSSRQSPAHLPPASNFISIHKVNGSIKGTWVVDTDLKVPDALLAPPPSTGERHNLSLTSFNGPITVDVAFQSGSSTRASILLDTKNGEIDFNTISSKNDQPFKAVLRTCNGAIHVQLPRSFTGPIKHRTSNGSYKFSKGVQERLRSVSSNCSFIGSWEDSGFVDYEQWGGYELDASTPNGSIKFSYYDEGTAPCESKGRQFLWFKR